jgi:hypothetical protein
VRATERRPEQHTPDFVSPVKAHGGNRASTCPTCGAVVRRVWCNVHDPDQGGRKRAHAERVALYRVKAQGARP